MLDELGAANVRVYRTDTLGLSSFLLNGTTIQASTVGQSAMFARAGLQKMLRVVDASEPHSDGAPE